MDDCGIGEVGSGRGNPSHKSQANGQKQGPRQGPQESLAGLAIIDQCCHGHSILPDGIKEGGQGCRFEGQNRVTGSRKSGKVKVLSPQSIISGCRANGQAFSTLEET